jgi:hypothetical protein
MISGFSVTLVSSRVHGSIVARADAPREAYLQRSMRLTRSGYCMGSGAPSSTIYLGDAGQLAEARSAGIGAGRAATERTRWSAAQAAAGPAGAAGALCSKVEAVGGGEEEDPAAGGGGDAAE